MKSINDFPKDVRDTVHELLAKAAERKAAKNHAEAAKGA